MSSVVKMKCKKCGNKYGEELASYKGERFTKHIYGDHYDGCCDKNGEIDFKEIEKNHINNREMKEWYCVICSKTHTNKELYTDLGSFNSSICIKCKDTQEAKDSLGLD